MGSRRDGRILAVSAIYIQEITDKKSVDRLLDEVISFYPKPVDEHTKNFAANLISSSIDNRVNVEKVIKENIVGWEIQRLNPLDKAFLRLGITEILYFPDVPAISVMDELIEIAKEYGGSSSPRFVNGVLDSVYKKIKKSGGYNKKDKDNQV